MGGYKFLMKYYRQGDGRRSFERLHLSTNSIDIYIFGFSRGAYIARFLAEMLDYIGLLEAGNEEMVRKSTVLETKSFQFCVKTHRVAGTLCMESLCSMATPLR